MKAIDFTRTGGFPLTQDELDYLQQAYSECIRALAAMGGDGSTPFLISGMVQSEPLPGDLAVSDGWFFYNGDMIAFNTGTVTPIGLLVPVVEITSVASPLTYNDGLTHSVILNKTATVILTTAITDAMHFPLSDMVPYQLGFGLAGREATWNSMLVNTPVPAGNVFGTIYYKKNYLNNTLHIRANLTANNAQNFPASPGAVFSLMGTLPSGYIPATAAYFTSYYYAANLFKDDLGVSWVKLLTSGITTSGQIQINFIKPETSILAYSVVFNTIIPLD